MGKQTEGADAFKKYINPPKKGGPRKPDEHDKAWAQIREQSDPINVKAFKSFKFGGSRTIWSCTNCIHKSEKEFKTCPICGYPSEKILHN